LTHTDQTQNSRKKILQNFSHHHLSLSCFPPSGERLRNSKSAAFLYLTLIASKIWQATHLNVSVFRLSLHVFNLVRFIVECELQNIQVRVGWEKVMAHGKFIYLIYQECHDDATLILYFIVCWVISLTFSTDLLLLQAAVPSFENVYHAACWSNFDLVRRAVDDDAVYVVSFMIHPSFPICFEFLITLAGF
jgi:hypothetical protein